MSITIAQLCKGRLTPLPQPWEASREERIEIETRNIEIMAEELGYVPGWYPQSAAEVPGWIDDLDRRTALTRLAIQAVAAAPEEAFDYLDYDDRERISFARRRPSRRDPRWGGVAGR